MPKLFGEDSIGQRPGFLNQTLDHFTTVYSPDLYQVWAYTLHVLYGIGPVVGEDGLLYRKPEPAPDGTAPFEITRALSIGQVTDVGGQTILALVQSHPMYHQLRQMLGERNAHFQHLALSTSDIAGWYDHLVEHGINPMTPILREGQMVQFFWGLIMDPRQGMDFRPNGVWLESVQRLQDDAALQQLAANSRYFRDESFNGLLAAVEHMYRNQAWIPFMDADLYVRILAYALEHPVQRMTLADLCAVEGMMLRYGAERDPITFPDVSEYLPKR
jgi:hypothetical protein